VLGAGKQNMTRFCPYDNYRAARRQMFSCLWLKMLLCCGRGLWGGKARLGLRAEGWGEETQWRRKEYLFYVLAGRSACVSAWGEGGGPGHSLCQELRLRVSGAG
jgi:hypothetical protein